MDTKEGHVTMNLDASMTYTKLNPLCSIVTLMGKICVLLTTYNRNLHFGFLKLVHISSNFETWKFDNLSNPWLFTSSQSNPISNKRMWIHTRAIQYP